MTRVHSKSWKLLAAVLGTCVILSACGTSKSAEPQEELPVEQTSSPAPSVEAANGAGRAQ